MQWWGRQSDLQRQARELRQQISAHISGNGNDRATNQRLISNRKRFRLGPYLAAALVFIIILGARRCRPTAELTPEEMAQARVDIYIGCRINKCSSEKLENLLMQLEGFYTVRKE